MFEELKDYIASHTKEEIQEDWKETPEFESGMTVEEFLQYLAKAGYNEPNEVYYCLDQNNNPKIECIEPGIQNSDFEDLYTVPYTYELIDWLLISVAPKSDSVATQVINDFRNNKYEIYKTEIINSDTTYYYRLKQKE